MVKRNKLNEKIKDAGYSMKSLSVALSISVSALGKRMSGKTEFKGSEICRLAELLSLSRSEVEEYFFGKEVSILETC